MFEFGVPITVDAGHQRSLEVKTHGFRATFRSAVSGVLRLRKKRHNEPTPRQASPLPKRAATAGEIYDAKTPPYVEVAEVQETLLSHGIKVRDFGYQPTLAGHLHPGFANPDFPSMLYICIPGRHLSMYLQRKKPDPSYGNDMRSS
jgi:hypothetical protein